MLSSDTIIVAANANDSYKSVSGKMCIHTVRDVHSGLGLAVAQSSKGKDNNYKNPTNINQITEPKRILGSKRCKAFSRTISAL